MKEAEMEAVFKLGAKMATVQAIVQYIRAKYPDDEYLLKLIEALKDDEDQT